jgi:predicted NAD/FAD-dependent oxidoreductase
MKNMTDVVIIGGGISGLYTAKKCIENGLSVLLLEKGTNLGGRIRTIYHPTFQYEAGAGRFSDNHRIVRSLLKEYHLQEVPNPKRHTFMGKPSPAHALLSRVFASSSAIPSTVLSNITFQTLCERILGKNDTQTLVHAFGYNAEFHVTNAKSALDMFRRDFADTTTYYSCKQGLSALVHAIQNEVATHAKIYMQTRVTNVEDKGKYFVVHANDGMGRPRKYIGRVVVCAIPKDDLGMLTNFTHQQRTLLDTVSPVSLHRIYGAFPHKPKPWFSSIYKTSTPDHVRQFIPVDKRKGLAMVSYSDTKDADFWKSHADKGADHLKREVLKHLHAVFPDVNNIPAPQWIDSYYWPAGVHMWKKGVDTDVIQPKVRHIMGEDVRFFVVGEAYCKIQGWIEGALESVEDTMPHLLRHFAQHGGKKTLQQWILMKDGQLSRNDLSFMRRQFPEVHWVLLSHPVTKEVHAIDVTEWSKQHPGGNVFDKYLYNDISGAFNKVPYHKDIFGGWKQHVIDMIDRYSLAVVR